MLYNKTKSEIGAAVNFPGTAEQTSQRLRLADTA